MTLYNVLCRKYSFYRNVQHLSLYSHNICSHALVRWCLSEYCDFIQSHTCHTREPHSLTHPLARSQIRTTHRTSHHTFGSLLCICMGFRATSAIRDNSNRGAAFERQFSGSRACATFVRMVIAHTRGVVNSVMSGGIAHTPHARFVNSNARARSDLIACVRVHKHTRAITPTQARALANCVHARTGGTRARVGCGRRTVTESTAVPVQQFGAHRTNYCATDERVS